MSRSRTPSPVNNDLNVDEWLDQDGQTVEMQDMSSKNGSPALPAQSSSSAGQSDLTSILSLANAPEVPAAEEEVVIVKAENEADKSSAAPSVVPAPEEDSSTPLLSRPPVPAAQSSITSMANDEDEANEDENEEESKSDNEEEQQAQPQQPQYSNTFVGRATSGLSNVFSRFGLSSGTTSTATPSGMTQTLAQMSITNTAKQPKPDLDAFVVWKGQFQYSEFVHVMCSSKAEGIELGREILAILPSLKRKPWVYHAGEKDQHGNLMGEQYPDNKEVSFFRLHKDAYESLRRLQPGLNLPVFADLVAYQKNSNEDVFTQKSVPSAAGFRNN